MATALANTITRQSVLDVQVDQAALDQVQAMLRGIPGGMRKVSYRACNKVADRAKTRVVRELHSRVQEGSLQQKGIRDRVKVHRARKARPWATVRLYGKGISLLRFKARANAKGVTYIDPAGGGRKLARRAFIATMPRSRAKGVFRRREVGRSIEHDVAKLTAEAELVHRLPIDELTGPSLSDVLRDAPGVLDAIVADAYQDLQKEIITQAEVFLRQYMAKRPHTKFDIQARLGALPTAGGNDG